MQQHFHTFVASLLVLLLTACAGLTPAPQQTETGLPWQAVWQSDTGRHNRAVQQLIRQADDAIRNANYDKAASLLERVLRIDNRVASVWSRLGWLAMQQQQARRAQNLLMRSNSLSRNNALRKLNWRLYRRASEAIDDRAGVARAEQKLAAFD